MCWLPWMCLKFMISEFTEWLTLKVTRFLTDHRLFRTSRWVYLAWIMVYSSEDDQGELEIQTTDEEERDYYFVEEYDLPGEHGEDEDELGANSFRHDQLRTPWEWWFQKEVDSFYDEGLEIARSIVQEELSYYTRLLLHPWVDFLVRLPLWGTLKGISLVLVSLKLEWQRLWFALLRHGNVGTQVVGRWWKIPLVLGRLTIKVGLWWLTFWWLVNQLSYSTLKIFFLYSLELTFHDTYYLGWILFCFFSSAWLFAPTSLYRYFFVEIGASNLFFLWTGINSLTFPEEYYPTRLPPPVRSVIHDRLFLEYQKLPYFPVRSDRYGLILNPETAAIGLDPHRIVPAQFKSWNHSPFEPELDDYPQELQWSTWSSPEYQLSDWYETDVDDVPNWFRNGHTRHPRFARHNFYDRDFITSQDPHPWKLPLLYPEENRNDRTVFTRDASESSSYLSN